MDRVIACGGAPYRTVLTHGFILDEERRKISKSNTYEKPQTSDAYIAEYGADVIRLWISSQNFRDDIPISKEILSHVGETYRLLRNTLRFQLSNLFDFDPARDALPVGDLHTSIAGRFTRPPALLRQCTAAYEAYEFHRVYQLCNQFCAVTLSATYHDILKDRLYTLEAGHPLRRSSQTAITHCLSRARARARPDPHLHRRRGLDATPRRAPNLRPARCTSRTGPRHRPTWTDPAVDAEVSGLLAVRTAANEKLEALRQSGAIGKSLDAAVTITGVARGSAFSLLEKHRDVSARSS